MQRLRKTNDKCSARCVGWVTILDLGPTAALLTQDSSHDLLELTALSAISWFPLSELGYGYAGVVCWSEGFSPSLEWMLSIA